MTTKDLMIQALDENGYRLNLSNDQSYQLVLDVVQKALSKEDLWNYLQQQIEQR
jgi:prophage maintenance system killer protein